MSMENILERIAVALETIAGRDQFGQLPGPTPVVEQPKKQPRAKKPEPVEEDTIPGVESAPEPVSSETSEIKTGADLRNLAQRYIKAAELSDPGEKNGTINKVVTFMQSVSKIFNPKEPKLIKVPDEKAAEAAKMIVNWCDKNGIELPIEV